MRGADKEREREGGRVGVFCELSQVVEGTTAAAIDGTYIVPTAPPNTN